jgi:hypothetical protein
MSNDVFANETNKANMVKTKEGDTQSGYLQEKIIGSAYVNITEDDGASGKCLVVEVDGTALAAGVSTNKVKCSSNDTTPDYLSSKLVAGTGITITTAPDGGNEKATIAGAYTAGTGISITGASIASTITQVVTETFFTGNGDVVPESLAVGNLLRTTTITDSDDVVSGDALLFRTTDIPATAISVIETIGAGSVWGADKYPSQATVLASTDISYNNANGAILNRRGIYSIYDAIEGNNSWAVALVPISFHEDFSNEDNIAYLDVLFACPKTVGDATVARVKADVYLWDGNGALAGNTFDPDIQDVDYEISTGADKALKITFTLDLNAFGGASAPDFTTWVSGVVVLSCEAENASTPPTSQEAKIMSARLRYKTKTIGLRIDDVTV